MLGFEGIQSFTGAYTCLSGQRMRYHCMSSCLPDLAAYAMTTALSIELTVQIGGYQQECRVHTTPSSLRLIMKRPIRAITIVV